MMGDVGWRATSGVSGMSAGEHADELWPSHTGAATVPHRSYNPQVCVCLHG